MKINTVCMTLVASRNLTTLFASLCMLHPDIQVLNHFPSINDDPETNFIIDYSDEKLDNFVDRVSQINRDCVKVPGEGGVITAAHAFKSNKGLDKLFYNRFSSEHKEDFKSIVWKDSPRNMFALQDWDLDELFSLTDKLRFILTVRNPMDCAASNNNLGYDQSFKDQSLEGILKELFERYDWFFAAEKKYPKYFMNFFEFDPNERLLDRLQEFLMVDNDDIWKRDFLKSWNMRKNYKHSPEFKKYYLSLINDHITDRVLIQKFKRYLNG